MLKLPSLVIHLHCKCEIQTNKTSLIYKFYAEDRISIETLLAKG